LSSLVAKEKTSELQKKCDGTKELMRTAIIALQEWRLAPMLIKTKLLEKAARSKTKAATRLDVAADC